MRNHYDLSTLLGFGNHWNQEANNGLIVQILFWLIENYGVAPLVYQQVEDEQQGSALSGLELLNLSVLEEQRVSRFKE